MFINRIAVYFIVTEILHITMYLYIFVNIKIEPKLFHSCFACCHSNRWCHVPNETSVIGPVVRL